MKKIAPNKTQKEITTEKNQNKQTDKNIIATITTKQTNKTKPKRRKKSKSNNNKAAKT